MEKGLSTLFMLFRANPTHDPSTLTIDAKPQKPILLIQSHHVPEHHTVTIPLMISISEYVKKNFFFFTKIHKKISTWRQEGAINPIIKNKSLEGQKYVVSSGVRTYYLVVNYKTRFLTITPHQITLIFRRLLLNFQFWDVLLLDWLRSKAKEPSLPGYLTHR